MAFWNSSLLLALVMFVTLLSASNPTAKNTKDDEAQDLVRSSCTRATYPNLCLKTLTTFSGPADTPRDLAKAAVQVSISKARKVSKFLSELKSENKREANALKDCVEQMGDSIDGLTKTLSELKHLRRESFEWQMNNAETWVSAALTDEDTCLDGFKEMEEKNVRDDVRRKIVNVARVTSNALDLINLLDESRHS